MSEPYLEIGLLLLLLFSLGACKTASTIPTTPEKTSSLPKTIIYSESQTQALDEQLKQQKQVENTPPALSTLTNEEQIQQLNQQLDDKFTDFDRLLLRERQFLSQDENEQTMPQDSNDDSMSTDNIDALADTSKKDSVSSPNDTDSAQKIGSTDESSHEKTSTDVPPDFVDDDEDDDIIARQLREAALNEKEPKLREKLWDEYKRYKESVKR